MIVRAHDTTVSHVYRGMTECDAMVSRGHARCGKNIPVTMITLSLTRLHDAISHMSTRRYGLTKRKLLESYVRSGRVSSYGRYPWDVFEVTRILTSPHQLF